MEAESKAESTSEHNQRVHQSEQNGLLTLNFIDSENAHFDAA